MNVKNISKSISISKGIYDFVLSFEKKDLIQTLNLTKMFIEKFDIENEKLPFRLNLLTEMRFKRIRENAHSRIIHSFLNYRNNQNKYILLQSFFENNQIKFDINEPRVRLEKDNMDISILDSDYAIVIENKFNKAIDRPNQLIRYVQTLEKKGYNRKKNIFVLYLTGDDKQKTPSEDSLPSHLRKDLELNSCYLHLSFKDDILPWLSSLLRNDIIDIKEHFLFSSIFQYQDFLDLEFNKHNNKITKKMDEKLKEFLMSELSKDENIQNTDDLLKSITDHKEKMEKAIEYLNELYSERLDFEYRNAKKKLQLAGYDIVVNDAEKEIEINFLYNKKNICCNLHFPADADDVVYFGVYKGASVNKIRSIDIFVKDVLFSQDEYVFDDDNYYAYKDSTYEVAVEKFLEMYNSLKIKSQKVV